MKHQSVYSCPCDFALATGLDAAGLRQVGLADDVLYRTLVICKHNLSSHEFLVRPCRKDCERPCATSPTASGT